MSPSDWKQGQCNRSLVQYVDNTLMLERHPKSYVFFLVNLLFLTLNLISLSLYLSLSIYLSMRLSIYLFIYLSILLYIYPCIYIYVYNKTIIYLYIHPSTVTHLFLQPGNHMQSPLKAQVVCHKWMMVELEKHGSNKMGNMSIIQTLLIYGWYIAIIEYKLWLI